MGMIKCPECGKELSSQAVVCPNCGKPIAVKKKKGHGCLISLLSVIIFFGIVGAIIAGTIGQNSAIQQGISGVTDDSEYITKSEFNSIKTGMSYDEVKEIVGSAGTVSSEVEANGIKIVIITWYGNGVAGSNANVTFTNNEVSGKAQVGLK